MSRIDYSNGRVLGNEQKKYFKHPVNGSLEC